MVRTTRRTVASVGVTALLATGVVLTTAPTGVADSTTMQYVVLAEDGASLEAAEQAAVAAGATVTNRNSAVGMLTVTAAADGFAEAASASAAVYGVAQARPIGTTGPDGPARVADPEHENLATVGAVAAVATPAAASTAAAPGMDPLDHLAWGLSMVRSDQARAVEAGDRRVLVGILDSGIDASHPDLAGKVDLGLSRNFVTDIPTDPLGNVIDGPCEYPGCVDPANVDHSGHGTHVAGTVGAALNGLGVSGVAPDVTLVNIRGGQDGGFLFLEPVVNALTYGADIGLDVINMSFYVDPWLYNCTANPADSPEAQAEQRTIIKAMNRALSYAHVRGVTLVGSLGNNHEDLGKPRTDLSSPDYPVGTAYPRPIDNGSCVDLPVEGPHVIGVSGLGPSKRKADYSNYGVEQISVAAPGGWFRDGFGTPTYRTNENMILSTYPSFVLAANGWIDANGEITPTGVANGVVKDCDDTGTCGFYRFIQGTSMASPHATGVAALIVSKFGLRDPRHRGGVFLPPALTERILTRTAAEHACPVPPLVSYANEGRPAEFDALCEGTEQFNGFYGHGIVDAYAAVTSRYGF